MMRWLAGAILITALAAPAFGEVTTKDDRFTGATIITRTDVPTGPGSPDLFVLAVREDAGKFGAGNFGYSFMNRGWEYLTCHSLHVLADGQRVVLPPGFHKGESLGDGFVAEHVLVNLTSMDPLRKMAAAETVEVKVCNEEFTLTGTQLLDLRNVVRAFDGAPPIVPPPPEPLERVEMPRAEVCTIAPGLRGCPDTDYKKSVQVADGEGVCVTTMILPPELKVLDRGKFSTPATTVPGAMQREIAAYARVRGANGATYAVGRDGSASATVYRFSETFYLDCAAAGGNWY